MTLRQANHGDPHRVSGHQSIIRRMRGEELSELTGGGLEVDGRLSAQAMDKLQGPIGLAPQTWSVQDIV